MNNVNHNFQLLAQQHQTMRAEFLNMKTLIQAMVPRIVEMGGKLGLDGFELDPTGPSITPAATPVPRDYVTRDEVAAMIKKAVDDLRAEHIKANTLQEANILDLTEKMAARVALREVARIKPSLGDVSVSEPGHIVSAPAASKSKRKSKTSVVSIDDFIPERAQTTEETAA